MTDDSATSAKNSAIAGNPANGAAAGAVNAAAAGKTATAGKKDASQFDIPPLVQQKYSDLVPLIISTESMNDEERQYWFQILPIMTPEQVQKLRDILENEKKELTRLDKEYEDELKKINDKHLVEWKEYEAKEKRDKRKQEEATAESSEASEEEQLLNKLQQL